MSPLPDVEIGNEEHLYNIGVVSRMTNISMATLRAWERRYNFPEAERTHGGHRLFSEKDILRLRWVKSRIDEGMQTAQAIQALHHQEQSGHQILIEQPPFQQPVRQQTPDFPLHVLSIQERLFQALMQRDLKQADLILGEALPLSTPEDLILDVIGPTLARVGDAWEQGDINVAIEHLGTNYLRQRLLMWMLGGPPPRSVKPIVLACAPEEWHEGSLLAIGAILRRRSWPLAYLGQAVPLQDLAAFVRELKPSLVITVAMTESTATLLADWPHWMPEVIQTGKPIMTFGGRIFSREPAWRLRVQGTYLGDTIREGLDIIETLMKTV